MEKPCSFCRLAMGDLSEHKTEWFYLGPEGIVVDHLNPKGHAMRLLFVPTGHVPCGEESAEDWWSGYRLLHSIGHALHVERGLVLGDLDLADHSYTEHWHAQLCLDAGKADE